ncbi:MAG TPA: hypothetical protein DCG54_12600 [Anaerolineae bacterium]|jgi:uncharacterized protein (TIGR00251 family)|nr:DUF167 domain-containing protein [Anaerolineae bacterium]HAE60310.1 hypothetical protein [Anaerolineae bacterium]
MANRQFRLHNGQRGVALAVRVTPRASRNEVTEIQTDGTVKVRLIALPADDDANKQLVAFLAEVLGCPPTKLDIVAGLSGRDKLVSIIDMETEEVHQRLLAYIE